MNDKTRALRALGQGIERKTKAGWSRATGAGFIKDDIREATYYGYGKFKLYLFDERPYGHEQIIKIPDMSLRETEELFKFFLSL